MSDINQMQEKNQKRPSFYPMEFPNNNNSTVEIPGKHRKTEYKNITDVVINEINPKPAVNPSYPDNSTNPS